jgi:alkylated DNA repair dioxygenase AlkB
MSMTLLIDRSATVERMPLGDGTSWVDVVRGFVPAHQELFTLIHDETRWQQAEVLRYDKYVPEKRLGAMVRADTVAAVRQTGMHLESKYRVKFQGVGALLYRNGEDFQGLHSDREMKWLDDTLIGILVLGQRRPFVLRERKGPANDRDRTPAGQAPDDIDLQPGEGDLIVMGGRCQRDWLHGVPAADTDQPRISLTWRWTSRRGSPDTNPGYFDGRQFSDRPTQPGYRSRRS